MRAAKLTQTVQTATGTVRNYKIQAAGWATREVDCTFHQFAQEGESGEVYPVAIVELADGSVLAASLSAIRFV